MATLTIGDNSVMVRHTAVCRKQGSGNFLRMMICDADDIDWWSLTLCTRLPEEEMNKWIFREDTSFSTLDKARK